MPLRKVPPLPDSSVKAAGENDLTLAASPLVTFPFVFMPSSDQGTSALQGLLTCRVFVCVCLCASQGGHRQSERAVFSNLEEAGGKLPEIQVRKPNVQETRNPKQTVHGYLQGKCPQE